MSGLTFLLDSSVLLKLYYREERDADIAVSLRDGYLEGTWEIRLADLSFYELANSLHYSRRFSSDEINERIQSLLEMELQIYGFDVSALRLALDYCAGKKIAIYDAYLIAIAKHDDLTFITADEKLRGKLLRDPNIIALSEFRSRIQDKEK